MAEQSGEMPQDPEEGHESLPQMIVPQHGLTRFLRVRLEVQDGTLSWTRPRTVLGVIPLGEIRSGIPLAGVQSLRLRRTTPRPARLVSGLLLLAVPTFVLPSWIAVPVMAFGAWVALVSLGPALEIRTTQGRRHRAAVCFGHEIDADLFIDAVTGFIEARRRSGPGHGVPG